MPSVGLRRAALLVVGMFISGCASGGQNEGSPDAAVSSDSPQDTLTFPVDSSTVMDSAAPDVESADTGTVDGAVPDVESSDTGTVDSAVPDVATDVASVDIGTVDSGGGMDSAAPDVESTDTGAVDTSVVDDVGCATGATRACTASCGTTGTESCSAGAWGTCAPPREVCNLVDDDCDGYCDSILGCRIGVDRADDASAGLHFYTTTDSEATCCGYTVEQYDYFYLYAQAQTGLVPFYRCRTSTGAHLYTTDATCGGATVEGSMGWIATSSVCGSVPLYGLHNTSGDHLYTLSTAEAASAAAGGYVMDGTVGYVWAADCGGPGCSWPSPISMTGSMTTAATGFPTAWYSFPLPAGTQSFASLSGSVSVTNSASLYSEVLFILQYLPTGTCTAGRLPSTTPEYGPPGAQPLGQFIVKSPTEGTVTLPIDYTLPGGLPMSGCVLLGLNGGTVTTSHNVTAAASLTLAYTAAETPAQSILGAGGEFCFGQNWGCQGATTNNALSFALVTPIAHATHLVALYGDISDSTFDGTSSFGAPPAGAWTGTNDFYVYHGAECSAFGVASGIAGPGSYEGSIPADATHLLSVPLTGSGIGVSELPVYQAFSDMPLAAGDCLVTLWGVHGNGGFDNETQIFALVSP